MVASNGDIVHTYRDLLSGSHHARRASGKLTRKKFSPSLFVVHFGLSKRPEGLAHHTVLFGPRYRELVGPIDLPEGF